MLAVVLWGATNAGTKYVVGFWPAMWTGGSRFLLAGLILAGISRLMGATGVISRRLSLQLWLRGGLSLAVYIAVFNFALQHTAASHVALYLGAAPVWALLWEGWPGATITALRRYIAAAIALSGVFVLFWPVLHGSSGTWLGEVLGLAASVLWTNYGRQCKQHAGELSPVQITAHTMWRAGALLLPLGFAELANRGLVWRWDLAAIQLYCITFGSVVTFALWTRALKHWTTSQVLLFNNLIPLSTMSWSALLLGEKITPTFWLAMLLVLAGVFLGQVQLEARFARGKARNAA